MGKAPLDEPQKLLNTPSAIRPKTHDPAAKQPETQFCASQNQALRKGGYRLVTFVSTLVRFSGGGGVTDSMTFAHRLDSNLEPTTPAIQWLSLLDAAEHLAESPSSLRKKLDKASIRGVDGAVEAHLPGITARKLGRLWKLRFSREWS